MTKMAVPKVDMLKFGVNFRTSSSVKSSNLLGLKVIKTTNLTTTPNHLPHLQILKDTIMRKKVTAQLRSSVIVPIESRFKDMSGT